MTSSAKLDAILSLPPAMADAFAALYSARYPGIQTASDPGGVKLGSGGGVACTLIEAWRASGVAEFAAWLESSKKLLLMAGGQSRRLPAYAAESKALLPMPVMRWNRGERLDQTLLDVQMPTYENVLTSAPSQYRAMVTSGDVLLRFGHRLPPMPEVDVLGLGMWVSPEVASHFGVFFLKRSSPEELAFFLQKPEPSKIRDLAEEYYYLVDTGMWLLSAKAVAALMRKCGIGHVAADSVPREYELYAGFGLGLGNAPTSSDAELADLTAAALPLPDAEFYHLGTSRQLIESCEILQNLQLDQTKISGASVRQHPDQFILNSKFEVDRSKQSIGALWVENAQVPASWTLTGEHVITGVPENAWSLNLSRGQCLELAPVGETSWAIRPYGMDDAFRGALNASNIYWMGEAVATWFEVRGISFEDAGIAADCDLQLAPIFPVVEPSDLDGGFIQWMLSGVDATYRMKWLAAKRISAAEISEQTNLARQLQQRIRSQQGSITNMTENYRKNAFYRLDLGAVAKSLVEVGGNLEHCPGPEDPIVLASDAMLRGRIADLRKERGEDFKSAAFGFLRDQIVGRTQHVGAGMRTSVLEDQIVWARSPVRLDLAGGWSDTPPYCLLNGGKVLNLAVDLNGQPPIQVFGRLSQEPQITLRSIDQGLETRVRTWAELESFTHVGDAFSLVKAALALAGFHPRFNDKLQVNNLADQLRAFGGGVELTLLSAVPKGSGLGTSSILAATVLAALSEMCGHGWDKNEIFQRTIALEQLLTTGGGWQDQAGGIHRGIKLIETRPGFDQSPQIRWLPEHLFRGDYANRRVLLYYTGITRLAKGILQEIVQGMFLNSRSHLAVLDALADHAESAYEAIQSGEWDALTSAVARSWQLNCALDAGTNPPPVDAIVERVAPRCNAWKLLGAGGGGYLLLFAKSDADAASLRTNLTDNPPNARARFVDFSISDTGLQVTRS